MLTVKKNRLSELKFDKEKKNSKKEKNGLHFHTILEESTYIYLSNLPYFTLFIWSIWICFESINPSMVRLFDRKLRINLWWLFNARSSLYIYVNMICKLNGFLVIKKKKV